MVGPAVAGISTDYDNMTIEHVAPEKPKHGQPVLGGGYVASILNLDLPSRETNDKPANKSFEKKKELLAKCPIATSEDLHSLPQWGAKEITKRAQTMAETAYDETWEF